MNYHFRQTLIFTTPFFKKISRVFPPKFLPQTSQHMHRPHPRPTITVSSSSKIFIPPHHPTNRQGGRVVQGARFRRQPELISSPQTNSSKVGWRLILRVIERWRGFESHPCHIIFSTFLLFPLWVIEEEPFFFSVHTEQVIIYISRTAAPILLEA